MRSPEEIQRMIDKLRGKIDDAADDERRSLVVAIRTLEDILKDIEPKEDQ